MVREEYIDEEHPRRRKKKKHTLYALCVLLLGFAIIVLSLIVFFHIQKIEITGNEYCSDTEIMSAVQNDRYSSNSIYVCIKYALGYGEQPACFDKMKVGLRLPWVLKVEVKEKPIVGFLYDDEQEYAYFDEEGTVVKKGTEYIEGVPLVEGIDADNVELYKPVKSEKSQIFEEILEASQELAKYEMSTEKIVCQNNKIYVYVGKVCVALGNNVTSEKIAQISPIIEKLGEKEGTLHLENYSEGRETITFNIGEFPEEN